MRILLSNDDGYFAPGLAALAKTLAPLGEITVVAPERNRSGASNSLTLDDASGNAVLGDLDGDGRLEAAVVVVEVDAVRVDRALAHQELREPAHRREVPRRRTRPEPRASPAQSPRASRSRR